MLLQRDLLVHMLNDPGGVVKMSYFGLLMN